MVGRSGALLLIILAGCRGATPEPVARAEEEKAKAAAAAAAPAPAAPSTPAASAPQKPAPARDDAPVVVDPGGGDGRPVSLAEAAQAEKERRAHAGQPVAVINDKTLPKYAAKGQITVAEPKEKEAAGAPAPGAAAAEPVRDEQYWRGRALDIRERWHQAADDVKKLEQRSTELRQKFYLESEDFIRDNQIKPEWDRVLDKLRQARLDVEATQKELAAFLEEGRAAGALPGWLREGEDEEPEPPKKEEKPPAEAIDAPILEPPPGGR
jgi:hypothetical protein